LAEILLASITELSAADIDHLYRFYLERIIGQVQRRLKDYGAREEAKVCHKVLVGNPAVEILNRLARHKQNIAPLVNYYISPGTHTGFDSQPIRRFKAWFHFI